MYDLISALSNYLRKMSQFADLDRIDFAILSLLQNNARLTNKEVAAAIDLSPSSTHERIKRLWEIGAIRGVHAEIDQRALGVGVEALLMIELSKHERAVVDTFMRDVERIAEVRSAFLLSGRWDVIVHVVARDTAHLKDLALDKFTNKAGVTRIETAIVYDERRRYEVPMIRLEQKAQASRET
jgi:DNA-binding Lrp family transcriptional regulator